MKSTIYVLKDPTNLQVVYVGSTKASLKSRLSGHCADENKSSRKGRWIKELLASGQKPVIEQVEVVDRLLSLERELYWTDHFKSQGIDLLNSNTIKDFSAIERGSGRKFKYEDGEQTKRIQVIVPISKEKQIKKEINEMLKEYVTQRENKSS